LHIGEHKQPRHGDGRKLTHQRDGALQRLKACTTRRAFPEVALEVAALCFGYFAVDERRQLLIREVIDLHTFSLGWWRLARTALRMSPPRQRCVSVQ